MLWWIPTTSPPSWISQPSANSLLYTTTYGHTGPTRRRVLGVGGSFAEAALYGLMPPSGAANPNSLTAQSGNTRRISVLTEAPLVMVKPSSAWDMREPFPLTQQFPGGTTHREGGAPYTHQPRPLGQSRWTSGSRQRMGSLQVLCHSHKSTVTHSVRCL